MYYGVIFIALSFMAIYTFYKPSTIHYKNFKWIAFMLLFLTSGLRYETAVDWVNYQKNFESTIGIFDIFNGGFSFLNIINSGEPAFALLNSLIRAFTDNVQVLFFVISLISTTILFKSIEYFTERKYFFTSVFLYYVLIFWILDMSGIRQSIALSILFYAFKPLSENKLSRYLFLVFMAGMFHFSALIFIFGIFLTKKINRSVILTLFTIGMIFFVFRIRWMVPSIDSLYTLFSDNYLYLRMWNYTIMDSVVGKERPIFIMLFVNSFLYLFYFWGREKYTENGIRSTVFFNLYTLFMLVTFFFWEISDFGVRFGLYFSIGLIICLPYILQYFKKPLNIFVVSLIVFYGFINIRPIILEYRSVISYNPYQNYIIYSVFDLKSTGEGRRDIYINELEE
jgi:transmembrane protein EpsG